MSVNEGKVEIMQRINSKRYSEKEVKLLYEII